MRRPGWRSLAAQPAARVSPWKWRPGSGPGRRRRRRPPSGTIALVGFMGTGKSTVARLLARRLALSAVDMDSIIEEREGRPIPEIFRTSGEPYFRAMERTLVREFRRKQGLVISTGGGVILDPDNVADLVSAGLVVCLRASPRTILRRIRHETHRPLLNFPDCYQRICRILAARRSLYDSMPFQVDTNRLTPAQVADRIITLFRRRYGRVPPA